MTELSLSYFGYFMRRKDSLEKTYCWEKQKAAGKKELMKWIDSIEEAMGVNLQNLSRIAEDRPLWMSLIHRVARSQSGLNGMSHSHWSPAPDADLLTLGRAGLCAFL